MIVAEDERAKDGPGAFEDSVAIEFCDLEHDACGLVKVTRLERGHRALVLGFTSLDGESATAADPVQSRIGDWDRAEAGGARLETIEPLARWSARLELDGSGFELELSAVSAPIELADPAAPALAEAAGLQTYEQLCEVTGEVRVRGSTRAVTGVGRRVHAWGQPARGARLRSLYVRGRDEAVTLFAVRPARSEHHGDELLAAHLAKPGEDPVRFENARLSTVYDGEGRPRTAGLELYMPGTEYPRRVAGEAVQEVNFGQAGDHLQAAFFRWSFDGSPAQGGYQLVTAR
jgi:hypothetical protein